MVVYLVVELNRLEKKKFADAKMPSIISMFVFNLAFFLLISTIKLNNRKTLLCIFAK